MEYDIHMGVPEVKEFWDELKAKVASGTAWKKEEKLYKQLGKAMYLLSQNPRHPGLKSHEISALTARCGIKVWESYLENITPAAGRIFWSYGPQQGDITIVGIELHPNDVMSNAYKKITLSQMGKELY